MLQRAWLGQVPLQHYPGPARRQATARPAPQPRAVLSGTPAHLGAALTDANFSQILSAPMAVVDFWSPTCPYCVNYKPIFEDVAAKYGDRLPMVTVNVNDAPQSAGGFNIGGIPATIFLASGKEVHREEGSLSKAELLAAIQKAYGAKAPAAPSSGIPTLGIVGGIAAIGLAVFFALR